MKKTLGRKGNLQREVARLAGVSPATVSRVFAGSTQVNPALMARVREAAAKLGVEPNRSNRATLLAFLLCNRKMLHPFHSRVLDGAEEYCAAHEYSTVFLSFRYPSNVPWKEIRLPKILERRDSIAGYILAGTNSENLMELLRHRGSPFSVLGNNVLGKWAPDPYDVIWFDDIGGAYEATRHFQALGHRDIWYVGNTRLPWFARRYEGYCRAMTEKGMEPRLSPLDSEDAHDIGYLATKLIITRREAVTAILAGDDATAHGVYRALRDCSLDVPADVSVAGVNDLEGTMLHPRVTSVRTFPEQVGRQLAELVFNRLHHPGLAPQHRFIPTELAKRDSVAPPARGRENGQSSDSTRQGTPQSTVEERA